MIFKSKSRANKFCRCIKSRNFPNESIAIGICTKSIFNNKGMTRGKFRCKSPQFVKYRKTRKLRI